MYRPTSVIKSGLIAALMAAGFFAPSPRLLAAGPEDGKKATPTSKDEGQKSGSKDSKRERPAARERVREKLDALLKEHPEADKDKDGKLSPAEAREWARDHRPVPEGKRLEALLKRHPEADKDKDGKLSPEELKALRDGREDQGLPAPRARIEKLLKDHPEADADKDGKLSPKELREWRKSHPPAERKQAPSGKTPQKKTEEV
jgi:Ca2+-binding EF-hand superfamily protein